MDDNKRILFRRIGILLFIFLALSVLAVTCFVVYPDQLGSMVFALLIGGIGAIVSLVKRFPKLDEEKLNFLCSSWWILIVPITTGVVMAGLLYFIFLSGLVTGDNGGGFFTTNLFPNLSDPSKQATSSERLSFKDLLSKQATPSEGLSFKDLLRIRPDSVKDFGKLLVWCFLSGYSERLVSNLLDIIEKRAVDSR